MVGIQGIGKTPEPANARQVQTKVEPSGEFSAGAKDGIELSARAIQAAKITRLEREQAGHSEIREARVAEAKQNLRDGVHRVQEAVLQVAGRIEQQIS